MKIHKQSSKTVERYIGFGHYADVKIPLCVQPKEMYKGKSYMVHRLWKHVTCKNCLKKRVIKDE